MCSSPCTDIDGSTSDTVLERLLHFDTYCVEYSYSYFGLSLMAQVFKTTLTRACVYIVLRASVLARGNI
jgi:hypothetical protein